MVAWRKKPRSGVSGARGRPAVEGSGAGRDQTNWWRLGRTAGGVGMECATVILAFCWSDGIAGRLGKAFCPLTYYIVKLGSLGLWCVMH